MTIAEKIEVLGQFAPTMTIAEAIAELERQQPAPPAMGPENAALFRGLNAPLPDSFFDPDAHPFS